MQAWKKRQNFGFWNGPFQDVQILEEIVFFLGNQLYHPVTFLRWIHFEPESYRSTALTQTNRLVQKPAETDQS